MSSEMDYRLSQRATALGVERCFSIAFEISVRVIMPIITSGASCETTGSLPTPLVIILVNAENRSSSGYAKINCLVMTSSTVFSARFEGSSLSMSVLVTIPTNLPSDNTGKPATRSVSIKSWAILTFADGFTDCTFFVITSATKSLFSD